MTKLTERVERKFEVASELSKPCYFQNLQDLIELAPLLIVKKIVIFIHMYINGNYVSLFQDMKEGRTSSYKILMPLVLKRFNNHHTQQNNL